MKQIVFKQRLSSIMQDNRYDRVVRNRTRGKLDDKSLHKVSLKSRHLFKQKMERKGKRYNIIFAVDASGSMSTRGWGDNKMPIALDTLEYLLEAFQSLNIHTSVLTYNGKVVVHKPLSDKQLSKKEMARLREDVWSQSYDYKHKTEKGSLALTCNHDYAGLETAYKLANGQDGTSIVVVLSDGKPNCDDPSKCGYDTSLHNKNKIRTLVLSNRNVITIGVGLLYNVEQIPDAFTVRELEQLAPQVTTRLKKLIKRG